MSKRNYSNNNNREYDDIDNRPRHFFKEGMCLGLKTSFLYCTSLFFSENSAHNKSGILSRV